MSIDTYSCVVVIILFILITTVMNAFGIETKDASEIASAFFSAQKFGKTTVEESI